MSEVMGASSEHFPASELWCKHCHVNECTRALVDVLEVLRAGALEWWKAAHQDLNIAPFPGVIVHDAYRCPQWNARTPNAATHSQHMIGAAADISIPGMTAAQLEKIARTIPAIKGIGRADHQNYLHIDVRASLAEWCYDTSGATCAYYPPVNS